MVGHVAANSIYRCLWLCIICVIYMLFYKMYYSICRRVYLLWHIFRYSHDCQIVNTRTTNLLLTVSVKLDQSKIPPCMHEFYSYMPEFSIDAGIRLFEKLPTSQTQLHNKCSHFYLSVFLHSICYLLCFVKKTSSFMEKKNSCK
jgi:hypothetical protein